MPEIDILVPFATQNYIKNPSFENSTDGWNAVGSAISAVLTRARFQRKALKIVTNDAALNEGVYYRSNDKTLKGAVFASAYIRGAGKWRIRIKDGLTGIENASIPLDIHDDYWQRIWVQGITEGTDDTRVYVETAETSQGVTAYIDGVQLERTDYLTTYCDGEQDDCRWEGVSHASVSTRPSSSPLGGRWVNIRDDECDPTTYITTFSGLGLPPITINRQRMALTPGSFFDSSRAEERVIQLTVNIKDDDAQRRAGLSKVRLNRLRQHLIDLVKPDRDPDNEPMFIRYRDGDRAVYMRALYESGLEFEGDFRNKWVNTIPLRFLALDPFWYEDSQEVELLDTEVELDDVAIGAMRVDGEWQVIGQGFERAANTFVRTFEQDQNGTIYIGGNFDHDRPGNNMRNLCVLNDDYTVMTEVLTGLDNAVYAIKAHPNGMIYIGGWFQNDNAGNPYSGIVEYDPVANTFTALGSGADGDWVYDIDVAPNGDVYACGDFTSAGGVAALYVAKWDGGVWERLGDIETDLGADAGSYFTNVMVVSDTEVYVRGQYVTGGGGVVYHLLKFDGTNWTNLTDTDLGIVYSDATLDNQGLVITNGDAPEGAAYAAIYRFNGSSLVQIGETLVYNGNPEKIAVDQNGIIYITGRYTGTLSGRPFNRSVIINNGSVWTQFDVNSNFVGNGIYITKNGDVLLGFTAPAGAVVLPDASGSGITNLYCNSTAYTFPIITIEGSQRILWLENQTTGQVTYFNYDLNVNERLEIDFRPGIKSVISNYRGNVPDAILPNSSDIFLLPSDIDGSRLNKLAFFSINEVNPVVQLRYQPTHWSADAIGNQ